eukprot:scaffold34302_cov63-Phaeocystis_antarctica.AAC.1
MRTVSGQQFSELPHSWCSFMDTRVTVVQREAKEREASGEGVAVRLAATPDTKGAEERWRA